jgi:hypothetical protein
MTARAAVLKTLFAILLACACAGAAGTAAPVPTRIGAGPRYLLPATPPFVANGRPVGRLRCSRDEGTRELAHVELFAKRLVLLLPATIGIAPHCSYEVRTTQPTGVVDFVSRVHPTIGDLFSVWGQPLSAHQLAGFRGAVAAWVGGKRWHRDVRAIPLRRHSEIVIEVGGYVPPHTFFLFATTP